MLDTTHSLKLVLGGIMALPAALAVLLVFLIGAPASAEEATLGKVRIVADGNYAPKRLSARGRTPIRIKGLAGSIRNLDQNDQVIDVPFPEPNPRQPIQAPGLPGSRPPIAAKVIADFDKRGTLFTKGLPKCTERKLRNQTYMVAKNRCGKALVGEGKVNGVVKFPDQKEFVAPGTLLMFNGGPNKIIFHAWANPDVPTAFVVGARVTKAPGKKFKHRVIANIPRIANDNGALSDYFLKQIFRKWRWKGKQRSYLGAKCSRPKQFTVRARVEFRPDKLFPQSHEPMTLLINRPCKTK